MISPYDLGNYNLVEQGRKISIDELIRQAKKDFKMELVRAQIRVLGVEIQLTTSKTRFNGERLWFLCPKCNKRVHTLYQHAVYQTIGCRNCLRLSYLKQRFKGMIEASCL